MAEINIERLTLDLKGLTAPEGERVARMVAEGLAEALGEDRTSAQFERLNVEVQAAPGEDLGLLSGRVVSGLLRQLRGEQV